MKNYATKAFWIIMVLCSTAIAKPRKCQVRCYQYPSQCYNKDVNTRYCLQYPLMDDGLDPPVEYYYAYDQYEEYPTCSYANFDYGWAPFDRPCPQVCPNDECETIPPIMPARPKDHPLPRRFGPDEKLSDRVPDPHKDAQGKFHPSINDKQGTAKKWKPKKGLLYESDPEWVYVKTEKHGSVPVKVISLVVHFKNAANDANIVWGTLKPVSPLPRTVVLGVEADNDNLVAADADLIDVEPNNRFSGRIRINGSAPIRILTATPLVGD